MIASLLGLGVYEAARFQNGGTIALGIGTLKVFWWTFTGGVDFDCAGSEQLLVDEQADLARQTEETFERLRIEVVRHLGFFSEGLEWWRWKMPLDLKGRDGSVVEVRRIMRLVWV